MTIMRLVLWQVHIVFNSHPHKEDDLEAEIPATSEKVFNSHPHKEDDCVAFNLANHNAFSTHILTRRMTSPFSYGGFGVVVFQLTSSQGGWLMNPERREVYQFFNSHPHKEDDQQSLLLYALFYFSTHILTRRMTFERFGGERRTCFSTHILTRRMTAGCDSDGRSDCFSTHILTRRMTIYLIVSNLS